MWQRSWRCRIRLLMICWLMRSTAGLRFCSSWQTCGSICIALRHGAASAGSANGTDGSEQPRQTNVVVMGGGGG